MDIQTWMDGKEALRAYLVERGSQADFDKVKAAQEALGSGPETALPTLADTIALLKSAQPGARWPGDK